ncbi:hypothetical protein OUZ56_014309 [Daphnia magna]|uniref:DNA polymerase kappa n=1 Tax=Daphnia magna TaxID=35525 RepID=A0ABR0AJD2_9CRUS|nr:hypothetical protein OUZ56_014309 [Daphnia magna]
MAGNSDVSTEKCGPTESLGVMKLNDHKAGMQGLDTAKINQIIEEASKGSQFYQHKQKNQERINAKIANLKASCAKLTEEQKKLGRFKMDNLAGKLELMRDLSRTIVHVDMDAFYAAVEIRDCPELKTKPMAVGSSAMLTTSNYHARRFGVRAAMPGFIAKKLCPELVIVPTNFPKYTEVSRQVQKVFADYDPEFSAASLDEAYLDITDFLVARKDAGAEMTAAEAVEEMRAKILESTQLTASAGIAPNGMLAKVCSDKNKPNGQFVLENTREAVMEFIKDLPIRKISGIGNVTEQLLGALGVSTCRDLWDKRELLYLLFSESSYDYFLRVALGIGSFGGDGSERERKSVSCETTFRSTSDHEELCDIIRQLSADLARDLERLGLTGRSVTLKYKTDKFDVKTRITQLMSQTRDGAVIAKAAQSLLPVGLHLRLLGVRMSQLTSPAETGNNSAGRKQRTLDELLLAVECPARKKRKLDAQVSNSLTEADLTRGAPLLFTCPVCHSWRTSDGEVALNSHVDECLNQQVLYPEQQSTTSAGCSSSQSKLDRYVIRRAK